MKLKEIDGKLVTKEVGTVIQVRTRDIPISDTVANHRGEEAGSRVEFILNESSYDMQMFIDTSSEGVKCHWGSCTECYKDGTTCALGSSCNV